ncbi:hypothetical protein ACFRJ8_10635 [Arthrobacter sp. NPDC056886]|uniref:hypothetical protein n=1 Tax=Arthrobacter sp. NPDC056886 TaxID=3345960 RepID=UPI00366AD72D
MVVLASLLAIFLGVVLTIAFFAFLGLATLYRRLTADEVAPAPPAPTTRLGLRQEDYLNLVAPRKELKRAYPPPPAAVRPEPKPEPEDHMRRWNAGRRADAAREHAQWQKLFDSLLR